MVELCMELKDLKYDILHHDKVSYKYCVARASITFLNNDPVDWKPIHVLE